MWLCGLYRESFIGRFFENGDKDSCVLHSNRVIPTSCLGKDLVKQLTVCRIIYVIPYICPIISKFVSVAVSQIINRLGTR